MQYRGVIVIFVFRFCCHWEENPPTNPNPNPRSRSLPLLHHYTPRLRSAHPPRLRSLPLLHRYSQRLRSARQPRSRSDGAVLVDEQQPLDGVFRSSSSDAQFTANGMPVIMFSSSFLLTTSDISYDSGVTFLGRMPRGN